MTNPNVVTACIVTCQATPVPSTSAAGRRVDVLPKPKRLRLAESGVRQAEVELKVPEIPELPRRPTDFSQCLPQGWEQTMSPGDRAWVDRTLFVAKGKLTPSLRTWWYPPPIEQSSSKPNPSAYHHRRLFLWMPRKMWKIDFHCPHCEPQQSLRSKGLYNRVRLVLDIKDYYYLAAEYMDCGACLGTFISWDHRMLDQLPDGVRAAFPVVLTRKYACDQAVVSLLHSRTIGNSPTALQHNLQKVHSEEWLRRQMCYLSECARHRKGLQALILPVPDYQEAAPFPRLPQAKWFLSVYVRDVWSRLPSLLAAATSVYGSILKIDSTKKVCKKLQGSAAYTANWTTNVGNERGEIVHSVLTSSEGIPSLLKLADGLVERYNKAGQPPPKVMYTDLDCCSSRGVSWSEQKRHIPCIQDPPNIQLYTITRDIFKGGVRLSL